MQYMHWKTIRMYLNGDTSNLFGIAINNAANFGREHIMQYVQCKTNIGKLSLGIEMSTIVTKKIIANSCKKHIFVS